MGNPEIGPQDRLKLIEEQLFVPTPEEFPGGGEVVTKLVQGTVAAIDALSQVASSQATGAADRIEASKAIFDFAFILLNMLDSDREDEF